jgi:serine/threonine-protein kinase
MPDFVIGQVDVPDVAGMSSTEAQAALLGSYLNMVLGDAQFSASVVEGLVISQQPLAGAQVDPDTDVTVVLSLGQQPDLEAGAANRRKIYGRFRATRRIDYTP